MNDSFDSSLEGPAAENLICTYPIWPSIFVALFGLVFVVVGIYLTLNRQSVPFKSDGVSMPMPVWFPLLFLVAGLCVEGYALYLGAQAKNESISVLNGKILWKGAKANIRLNCALSDIRAGSFQVIMSNGNNTTRQYPTGYTVDTSHGVLRWGKQIRYCNDLCSLMTQASSWSHVAAAPATAATRAETKLLCTYPKKPALFLLGYGSFVFFGAILVPRFSPQLGMGPSPPWTTMITAVLFGASLLSLGIYYLMSAQNEHIAVDHETITWVGPTGKVKLACSFEDVNPGGFLTKTGQSGQVNSYSLQTRRGAIKWSKSIVNCDDLNALAHGLGGDTQ